MNRRFESAMLAVHAHLGLRMLNERLVTDTVSHLTSLRFSVPNAHQSPIMAMRSRSKSASPRRLHLIDAQLKSANIHVDLATEAGMSRHASVVCVLPALAAYNGSHSRRPLPPTLLLCFCPQSHEHQNFGVECMIGFGEKMLTVAGRRPIELFEPPALPCEPAHHCCAVHYH